MEAVPQEVGLPGLHWQEIAAVGLLSGVGFTVSLLIGGLAFSDPAQSERVTTAVLIGSVIAPAGATAVFRHRMRRRDLADVTGCTPGEPW